jgi:hypothetical protein
VEGARVTEWKLKCHTVKGEALHKRNSYKCKDIRSSWEVEGKLFRKVNKHIII